jgi:hypothetical protein
LHRKLSGLLVAEASSVYPLRLRGRGANPIAHVLQAIDEPLDLLQYNRWNVLVPEGQFLTEVGNAQFEDVLAQVSPAGIPEWQVGEPMLDVCSGLFWHLRQSPIIDVPSRTVEDS